MESSLLSHSYWILIICTRQKQQQPCEYRISGIVELSNTMMGFKKTLKVVPEKAREIERETRGQRLSSAWFIACRYCLTSTLFGAVLSRRPTTAPDNLVLQIIDPQSFTSKATQHGIDNEDLAVQKYNSHQKENDRPDLLVSPLGFIINPAYSFWVPRQMGVFMIHLIHNIHLAF